MTQKLVLAIGSLYGFLAVILGAFGAHAFKKILSTDKLASFETGLKYQMFHALALLLVGVLFKMNKKNTHEISETLNKNNLEYIPEAHCYLKFEDQIIDLTKINSKPDDFLNDLIEEIEISTEQITDYKVNYHKNYLITFLDNNKKNSLTLNDIWKIREQCIKDLEVN